MCVYISCESDSTANLVIAASSLYIMQALSELMSGYHSSGAVGQVRAGAGIDELVWLIRGFFLPSLITLRFFMLNLNLPVRIFACSGSLCLWVVSDVLRYFGDRSVHCVTISPCPILQWTMAEFQGTPTVPASLSGKLTGRKHFYELMPRNPEMPLLPPGPHL